MWIFSDASVRANQDTLTPYTRTPELQSALHVNGAIKPTRFSLHVSRSLSHPPSLSRCFISFAASLSSPKERSCLCFAHLVRGTFGIVCLRVCVCMRVCQSVRLRSALRLRLEIGEVREICLKVRHDRSWWILYLSHHLTHWWASQSQPQKLHHHDSKNTSGVTNTIKDNTLLRILVIQNRIIDMSKWARHLVCIVCKIWVCD